MVYVVGVHTPAMRLGQFGHELRKCTSFALRAHSWLHAWDAGHARRAHTPHAEPLRSEPRTRAGCTYISSSSARVLARSGFPECVTRGCAPSLAAGSSLGRACQECMPVSSLHISDTQEVHRGRDAIALAPRLVGQAAEWAIARMWCRSPRTDAQWRPTRRHSTRGSFRHAGGKACRPGVVLTAGEQRRHRPPGVRPSAPRWRRRWCGRGLHASRREET